MKHFLLVVLFFFSVVAMSQVSVTVYPADTTVCFRDSVAFTPVITGAGTAKITFQWQKNYVDLTGPGATDSIYSISRVSGSSPGIYSCIISVEGLGSDTSNDALLQMYRQMHFDTLYRYNPLGCAGECKGQFKALVSGGTPFANDPSYIYEWHGGHSQDTIVFGLCPGRNHLTATDSLGCSIDSSYLVDVLKSPKIDFTFSPADTIYLTNPTVSVAFPDSMKKYLANWTWDFGDKIKIPNLNPVSHLYSDTTKAGQIKVKLSFTDLNGCDTTITHILSMNKAELDIRNIFTPNGDGINEEFLVRLKEDDKKDYRIAYLGTELLVYDRWGKKVFNETDYKSENWDGNHLSDGTYFYILKCTGQYTNDVIKGSVTILRGK
jgi:gliding motility-associated-like protein